MDPLTLLTIGIGFLGQILGGLKSTQVPAHVVAAVEAAIAALTQHKQDIINRKNLEAQRG